jgi:DNA-binding NarL/FixJ family response regulator
MRLFIADANPEFRLALQMFLHQEPGMDVVGLAAHSSGLSAQVDASRPDVLLMDWRLPDSPITELIEDIQALKLPIRIVVLSVRPEDEITALESGADAYIGKINPPDDLIDCLRKLRDAKFDRNLE